MRVLSIAAALALGCGGGPTMVRNGAALELSSGKPANGCEVDRFVELVPSRVFARAEDSTGVGNTVIVRTNERSVAGFGVYRRGTALELSEILPELGEPELASVHLGRIKPISEKIARNRRIAWIALAVNGALAGVSTTMAIGGLVADNDPLLIAGSVGLGVTLVSALISLIPATITRPSRREIVYHQLRERLLIEGEDDLAAASRGAARYNQRVRQQCH